ncbi:hypothetical protein LEMLEM_LOCUS21742 [Lemmus lemmus]
MDQPRSLRATPSCGFGLTFWRTRSWTPASSFLQGTRSPMWISSLMIFLTSSDCLSPNAWTPSPT